MLKGIHYRRSLLICSGIILCTFAFVKCIDREANHPKPAAGIQYDQFSGSMVCANCHKNIYDNHIHTAHYLTTRPASEEYIKGSFEPGKNRFSYDPDMTVVMEKRDSGFYQVGYYKGVERIAKRFDIVVGSGSKGQTYITRSHDRLYQLPVSYFTAAGKWANSPQFPTHPVIFNRTITSRCLECHSTFAQKIPASNRQPEEFSQNQLIYGVDCEKCHGPAAKHVEFQSQNPKETKGKYIINPAAFSRQQNLDLCALCHGGRLQKTKPSFEFVSGDKLSDYFVVDTLTPAPDEIDVHGNQLGLLRSSKCFRMSQSMTCTTCHNTHENERGKIVLFSQRCISCHNQEQGISCKMNASLGAVINQNCIDCHMPLKPSKSITELLPGETKPTAALIRSHFIGIYPDETTKYKDRSHKPN
ncbi:MAG TPA: multiheme c-type cytochrome [Puia sp.]